MLTALSAIASAQAEPTKNTMTQYREFLNCASTHQNAIMTYKMSDMMLVVHSNASYLSKPKACSCASRHFFMSASIPDPKDNEAVLNLAQLLRTVMSSTAKAELGALYINALEAIPQQNILKEMRHKEPPHANDNKQQHITRHCEQQTFSPNEQKK
jgi:hypothetical protein